MDFKNTVSWSTLSFHFDQLVEMDPAQQSEYLTLHIEDEHLREELRSLLDIEKTSATYFESLTDGIIRPVLNELQDLPPFSGKVHNYTLLKKIGRGGMGSVYLGERSDDSYKNRVAVKILRRGMDTDDILARFRAERQILANLNHPDITHLLDGGITTDGRPYFVMEYVEGKSITEYCDDQQFTAKQRLKLFCFVCDAVAYAHRNLVIHRDLKPENILVTEDGRIKLLDFGIAKLISDDDQQRITRHNSGERLLTPEFASPEQVRGEIITTTSDIYQLGLILYQLLCGFKAQLIQTKSILETEKIILDENPQKPSFKILHSDHNHSERLAGKRRVSVPKLHQILKGDLDTIVMKSLSKEPERRFQSVLELKSEIERYLKGLPLTSRQENIVYRANKFLKRNRFEVAVSAAFISIMILFGIFYHINVTEERNHAQYEAAKSAQITSFLMGLFEANDPTQTGGQDLSAWDLIEKGEQQIELLHQQPRVQAQMYEVTGQIYRRMGHFNKAEELLLNAIELNTSSLGETDSETISAIDELGLVYSDIGDFTRADSLFRISLELKERSAGVQRPDIADSYHNLGYVLRRTGNYDEAEEMYRLSYEIRRQHFGQVNNETLSSLSSLGVTLLNKSDYQATEQIFREVLADRREIFPDPHPDLAMSFNNLGAVLLNIGNFDEAEQLFRESLHMRIQLFGEGHPKVALTMNNLGIALFEQKKYEEAELNFKRALNDRLILFGNNNVSTAISLFCLAELEHALGNFTKSYELYETGHSVFEEHLSENHSFTARSSMGMGSALYHFGDKNNAKNLIENGFQKLTEIHDDQSLEMALAHRSYGKFLQNSGNDLEAETHFMAALEILEEIEFAESIRQQDIRNLTKNYKSIH